MGRTVYSFAPRDEVADWIDENILDDKGNGWTSYCYSKVYKDQKKQFFKRFEDISKHIFYIIIGMVLISFSSFTINIFNFVILISSGVVILLLGFFCLFLEVYTK